MSSELDSKYSSMKENKYDNEIINKNEKELVRPYRKYQLFILTKFGGFRPYLR